MSSLPKVLYVDDEQMNIELASFLFMDDFKITTALSGMQALDLMDKVSFDAVISDMKMPKMNGLQFVIEAQQKSNDIPYFILSGFDLNDELDLALNRGVIKSFFQKPLDKELICDTIKSFL